MQKKQNKTSLVWFKNNLRVNDNPSLNKALDESKNVIAIYVFDLRLFAKSIYGFKKTEKFRAQFLIETITDLKKKLEVLNIPLFVYHNYTEISFAQLESQIKFDAMYCQKEWTDEETQLLDLVRKIWDANFPIHESYDQFLFHPEDIPYELEHIPSVFSEFRKKCEKYSNVRSVSIPSSKLERTNFIKNNTSIPSLKDLGLEDIKHETQTAFPFKGGETSALERLNDYFFETKKLGFYKKTRNGLIGTNYSSKFSPWLANGSISARTIYWQVKQFEKEHFKNDSTYWLIFELIWRDYFKYISLEHQNKIFKVGGILDKVYDWKTDEHQIQKWINGETRSSFVNANMIELKKTGWMSNRGRQNVASFFAKDMLLDWRIGAAYFETMLIDYDVHSNYGNWMYVAGVGNDPRDRKFNINLQAERYDTNGKFQKLWIQDTLF